MIDTTITIGNVIQTMGLLIAALVFYFKRDTGVATLLENHDVRIEKAEEDIETQSGDIRDLYKRKADKR